MLHQPYSTVYPLTWLFRRMLASDCPIALAKEGIDFMLANGGIILPHPREQLPEKWCLVLVSPAVSLMPEGKLLIVTGDWEHPIDIDPNSLLCCERLHDPVGHVIPLQQTRFMRARLANIASRLKQLLAEDPDALKGDAEIEAAKWLASRLKPDDTVLRDTYKADCMEQFKFSDHERSYDRVWKAARYLIGLPKQRKGGRTSDK
jgi:hypothetical protein